MLQMTFWSACLLGDEIGRCLAFGAAKIVPPRAHPRLAPCSTSYCAKPFYFPWFWGDDRRDPGTEHIIFRWPDSRESCCRLLGLRKRLCETGRDRHRFRYGQ